MDIGTVVFFGALVALVVLVIGIYNKLVTLKNRYVNGFSQIEVQLKRRYDLIPNLVETAKGYLSHERETLEAVISARNQALAGLQAAAADPSNAGAIQELASAEGALHAEPNEVALLQGVAATLDCPLPPTLARSGTHPPVPVQQR
ncbi:MAG: LemA family protein [Gammaproteobacteria bacterium]|nr:MAG: LemA family protein [Gammaproteobacteria bacterium]